MFKNKLIRKLNIYESIGLIIIIIIGYQLVFGNLRIVKANSHSDQDGYYLLVISKTNNLKINDYVALCIPDYYHANIARQLGLPKGECNFNTTPLIKHVAAKEGDKILITHSGVYINNVIQPYTIQLGNRLMPTNINQILLKDEFIVLGTNLHSFDSRYFGIVRRENILGKGVLLWKI